MSIATRLKLLTICHTSYPVSPREKWKEIGWKMRHTHMQHLVFFTWYLLYAMPMLHDTVSHVLVSSTSHCICITLLFFVMRYPSTYLNPPILQPNSNPLARKCNNPNAPNYLQSFLSVQMIQDPWGTRKLLWFQGGNQSIDNSRLVLEEYPFIVTTMSHKHVKWLHRTMIGSALWENQRC